MIKQLNITNRLPALDPDGGLPLNDRPHFGPNTHGMVDELIEVSVVAEDHMAPDIEKEAFSSALRARKTPWSREAINQEPIGMFVLQKSES
jgi:hypothetical protein